MRILAVAGPSGGHIFPALSFLDTLQDKYKDVDALLVLPKRSLAIQPIPNSYKVNYISISTIKFALDSQNVIAILNFFKGSLESMFILFRFRPEIVIGFGSLTSIPIIMFSWIFRTKTFIHEQNVIPGFANRFLAKFTDRIAVSFNESRDYFKDYADKLVLTGNPLRKELVRIDRNAALDFFKFNSDKFTILVMGGSQGSERINFAFLRAITALRDKYKLQIIHLTGSKNYGLLNSNYKDLKSDTDIRLFSFLEPMHYAYSASDLVISRAGAIAISEIMFFRLPAIIIPYPYAYKHQLDNAKVLQRIGNAVIINDGELGQDTLRQSIEFLLDNRDRLKDMRLSYGNFSLPVANASLAREVMSLN